MNTTDVAEYYNQTQFDYRAVWGNNDSNAKHFGFYDKNHTVHADALLNTNKILSNWAKVQSGDQILDAGCGQGGSSFWLAANKGAQCTGISLEDKHINMCKEKAVELNLTDLTNFVVADFTKTPFDDNAFDVFWAIESQCHAFSKADFYKEAFRVLKPGGRLIVADYIRAKRPLELHDEKLLMKWVNNWIIPDINSEKEHLADLDASGFKKATMTNVNKYVSVSLKNLNKVTRRWYWIEWMLYTLRFRSKVQHGNLVGAIEQYKAFQKDLWWYGVIQAVKPL